MESGDASDEEAPPCDPKSNNLTQKEQSKVISMLVDMETEDSLKRHAVMVVAQKIGLACADLLYHKTKSILFLLPPFSARVRFQSFFSNQTLKISIKIPYETLNLIQ